MHPTHMLSAMVDDRRRQLLVDANAFRRACPSQPRPDRLVPLVRRAVGARLVRLGQGLAGAPVPATGQCA